MPYQKWWLLKDRVCYLQLTGSITLEDIRVLTSEHEQRVSANTTQQNIHYIIDAKRIGAYPRNALDIKAHLAGRITHIGWVLLVSEDFFLEHLCNIFAQLFHFQVKSCVSVLDAYRFLQSIDEIPIPQHWPDSISDTMPTR